MSGQKLLDIGPQQLVFRFELRTQARCIFRMTNNSEGYVVFKVMTTNPHKYCVGPKSNVGVLKPKSYLEVTVFMHGPTEIPPNMQCIDMFQIRSLVASPHDTAETAKHMFNEGNRAYEECLLRVAYVFPTPQNSPNSERSVSSSPNASTQGRNGIDVGDLLMKGIAIVLLCLIVWVLVMKILPLIWSLTFMMTVLIVKLAKKLVSDSAEDWMLGAILYVGGHILTTVLTVFKRRGS